MSGLIGCLMVPMLGFLLLLLGCLAVVAPIPTLIAAGIMWWFWTGLRDWYRGLVAGQVATYKAMPSSLDD